jgi:membrane peptidoglycan carboxypeptidase
MFSYADGFEVTPLQLGTLVSAMANGGRLLVPQAPRPGKEQSKFSVKVRRQLDIGNDVWQRMVPGMVGAVNYGSGRRAYDPAQTVAGKTGTCIGQAGWVGLFTSYAPLANPRLAVVVITQGTDAHRHLPAAVAGQIYRDLNHRFGTPVDMQVASTLDDEEKDAAAAEAAENGENGVTGDAADSDQTAVDTSTPSPAKPAASESPVPQSKVKRVLMQVDKRPVQPEAKESSQPAAVTKTPAASTPSPADQRPRRTQPGQP